MNSGIEILDAMLLGKTDTLSPETLFLFSRTGLIHLFSASGFHMGAALTLSRLLEIPLHFLPVTQKRIATFLFTLLFMLFFGQLTGWSSPLVRAMAFAFCLQTARLYEIRISPWRAFFVSALVAILFGKSSFLSLTLSLLGMMGILLAPNTSVFSLAIYPWLFTLPLVIWHFHLISFSAPVWNLSFGLIWGVTILPLAIFSLILKKISVPTGVLDTYCGRAMEFSVNLLERSDQLIGGAFWVNRWHFVFFFLALILLFCGRSLWKWLGITVLLFLFFLRFFTHLIVLNVGQGDSLAFLGESGESYLIDSGKGNSNFSSGARSLERAGIGALDHLILTHADLDHSGGAELILLKHPVKNLWLRKELLQDRRILPALKTAFRTGTRIRILNWESPKDAECRLPPPRNSNEMSPICLATMIDKRTLLLTGDAGQSSERWFIHQQPNGWRADFLKVGHHGSRHSSSEIFLDTANPRYALISAGRKNPYGHPHPDTIERLENRGIEIFRTDRSGSLYFYGFGFGSEESILPGLENLFSGFLK